MSNDYSDMNVHRHDNNHIITGAKHVVKEWTIGVDVEDGARKQLYNVAQMPFIYKHIAAMPDVHTGIGATVGSVIPTNKAIVPAAVGCRVDKDVIDETPGAYKDIDSVMSAQKDLVEVIHTLKQCVCIKG